MTERNWWERFLDSLDTSGGHVVLLLLLLIGGVVMLHGGIPKGEDIVIGTFSALLVLLKEVHSNLTRLKEAATDEKNGNTTEGQQQPAP